MFKSVMLMGAKSALAFLMMYWFAWLTSATAHDVLPLGDGKISNGPEAGYLFACQQRFNPNAPGAHRRGDWIKGDEWYPAQKVTVDGAVAWPNAKIEITVEGGRRIVSANNLPLHETGMFPIRRDDDAYRYDRNPGRIEEQIILLDLPRVPKVANTLSCVPMGMIGFTLSGAALYNAVDARGNDAPAHEIQDKCNGHPQQTGQYHYHNYSDCQTDTRSQAGGHSDLLGYALDGFGIFGIYGEQGAELSTSDLDACHGHSHDVTWDGVATTLYHYHFTYDYPYTVGCFRGTPIRTQTPRFLGPPDRPPPPFGAPPR